MSESRLNIEGKEFIVLPVDEFEKMREYAESYLDERAIDKHNLHEQYGELFPFELVERIIEGESPLKVKREYRGLTQQELADKVGVSRSYITDIEAGRKDGSIKVMKKVAEALNLEIEGLFN